MATIVFLLDADKSKIVIEFLCGEKDFALIDMAKVRRKYNGSYQSEDKDKLICRLFADKLRRIHARASVVVNSYPRTDRQIRSVLKLLGQGFRPTFVVSGRTSRLLKEDLKRRFPGAVTQKKLHVPP